MTSSEINRLLEYLAGSDINMAMELQMGFNMSDMFKQIISDNKTERERRYNLWDEYNFNVPIFKRTQKLPDKSNKQINVPIRNHIIKQSLGYFLGNPIGYAVADSEDENKKNVLTEFLYRNKIEKNDNTLGEYVSVCGVAYRLCYIDTNGNERIINVKPWEGIVFYDATLDEPIYAMVYYQVDVTEGTNTVSKTKIEWYDKENITYYLGDDKDGYKLAPEYMNPVNPQPHMFQGSIPLIEFNNDTNQVGDFEGVQELCDEYNEALSDMANEIADNSLSTMVFKNTTISEEDLAIAKRLGAISLNGENADAGYIQKLINDTFYANHLELIEKLAIKYSDTVNMDDDKFSGGQQSGESRKWKLLALEAKVKRKEILMRDALRQQFDVIGKAWDAKRMNLIPTDITYTFTRSVPVELLTAADVNAKLVGTISDKARIALLPFITDVDAELKQWDEEKQASNAIQLDNILLNDNTDANSQ